MMICWPYSAVTCIRGYDDTCIFLWHFPLSISPISLCLLLFVFSFTASTLFFYFTISLLVFSIIALSTTSSWKRSIMATSIQLPSGVHLVGSIPLSSPEEVFTKIVAALPNRLQSIPDGETGVRSNYIGWQLDCFPKETIHKVLGGVDLPDGHPGVFTQESIKPSQSLESYKKFVTLRAQGTIPKGVRFQVSLPPPFNSVQGHTRAEFHSKLDPLYEKRILDSLRNIINGIPAEDLALQWDLCFEVIALEIEKGRVTDPFFIPHFSPIKEGILERVERICEPIPNEVPLGFHLCYGDLYHKHFVEPEDMTLLVGLANDIVSRISHPVSWIHVPVPKSRDDIAYFEPIKNLNIPSSTKIYLGLVHANDEEGTRKRIKTAQSVLPNFGIATECGIGRTPEEELDSILRISKAVTEPAT
jgi:hypothetical protein